MDCSSNSSRHHHRHCDRRARQHHSQTETDPSRAFHRCPMENDDECHTPGIFSDESSCGEYIDCRTSLSKVCYPFWIQCMWEKVCSRFVSRMDIVRRASPRMKMLLPDSLYCCYYRSHKRDQCRNQRPRRTVEMCCSDSSCRRFPRHYKRQHYPQGTIHPASIAFHHR